MDEENKTNVDPLEDDEQPAAGSMTGSSKIPADQPEATSASTPAPATTDAETAGTNPGPYQEQAGMRS